MPTGTVTATEAGSTAVGISMTIRAVTGQNASPIGISQGTTSTTPSLATGTGVTTGSVVFFANLGLTGTYTVNGASTYFHDVPGGGLEFITGRATATMTGGSSVTVGGTATANSIAVTLLEILKGAGSITDTGIFAGGFTSAIAQTSTTLTPAGGSLLVVIVNSNGLGGVVTMGITDTLGGLTWTERVKQNGAGNGYCGLWTAPVPVAAAAGMLLSAGI